MISPDSIQWLQTQSLTAEAVGWKAAILSDFKAAGIAVPPGFIISSQYFQGFVQELSLPLAVPPYSARQLWQIAEKLQQQVDTLTLQGERSLREAYENLRVCFPNALYILRPSIGVTPRTAHGVSHEITHHSQSQPRGSPPYLQTTGLLESVLHPIDNANEEKQWLNFCEALRSLYRQCFQARSLVYWHHHQQPLPQIPLGVLVQPLLPALAAGTIEISPQGMTVSATWGLGLSLTRGEVIPDRYFFKGVKPTESPTLQLGQKSWAYWHPQMPVIMNYPVEAPPSLRTALTLQKVTPDAQQQPVLSLSQLSALREQALELLPLLSDRCSLEWLLSPSGSNSGSNSGSAPSFLWTQGSRWSLEDVDTGKTCMEAQDSDPPYDRSLTHIQGQAVSKGVQSGQVYALETLDTHFPTSDFPPIILVGHQLTPAVFPWLKRVRGLVLAQGGMTSHGAIVARELQIPAIVGVSSANLQYLLAQNWIRVDGNEGFVQVLPEAPSIAGREIPQGSPLPDPESLPPTQTRILATLNQVASLEAMPVYPVDGVGLLRSEWFCLDLWEGQHPRCWIAQGRQAELRHRLRDRIQECIQAIHPRPLFYRSVDCRAAELQSLVGQETFPWTVGGTFAHCADPSVLALEFEMLHQIDRSGSPVHLVLPMVRTVEEFIHCRDRYQAFLQARTLDHETPDPFSSQPLPLWIMVEVPSLLLQLPALAEAGVQGLIIGPGDLSHYLLGLDRGRSEAFVYELHQPITHHPIVHQAILNLLNEAQQLQLPTILCCHSETLPHSHLEAYVQAGLWGITAELPHIRSLHQGIVQSELSLSQIAPKHSASWLST